MYKISKKMNKNGDATKRSDMDVFNLELRQWEYVFENSCNFCSVMDAAYNVRSNRIIVNFHRWQEIQWNFWLDRLKVDTYSRIIQHRRTFFMHLFYCNLHNCSYSQTAAPDAEISWRNLCFFLCSGRIFILFRLSQDPVNDFFTS